MSRHQIGVATPLRPIQVSTPKPGRDPPGGYPMSQHQFYVATSFLTTPGRDLTFMWRPQIVFPRSQHEFHVTTQDPSVLTSARSRHQKGCRYTNPLQSRSRRQNDVATSPCLAQVARTLPRSWASAGAVVRAAARTAAPALRTCCSPVTTSKPGHDPMLEIGSNHSSFCLTPKFFFFFFKVLQ